MNQLTDYSHLAPGEQVRINHESCPAGLDTRERLYIKRSDDGSMLLGFCHNCGKKYSKRVGISLKPLVSSKPLVASKKVSLPIDMEMNPTLWPSEARAWVLKGGLDISKVKSVGGSHLGTYGLGWSPRLGRLVMPIWRGSDLLGYQARSFEKDATKYLTFANEKPLRALFTGSLKPDTLVVVEDMLSAIRVAEAGYSSFACLGSGVAGSEIYALSKKYRQLVIWLDNDKPEILQSARRLLRYGELFFSSQTGIVLEKRDPKKYSQKEIQDEIK